MKKLLHLPAVGLLFLAPSLFAQHAAPDISHNYVIKTANDLASKGRWGLIAEDMKSAQIQDLILDQNGITHAYVQQTLNGILVMNGIMGLHFNVNGGLIYATNRAVAHINDHVTGDFSKLDVNTLGNLALKIEALPSVNNWTPIKPGIRFDENGFYSQPMLCDDASGNWIATQYFVFYNLKTSDWVNLWLAADGSVVKRTGWTVFCKPGSFSQAEHLNVNSHSNIKMRDYQNAGILIAKSTLLASGKGLQRRGDGATYKAFAYPTESPLYGSTSYLSSPADGVASPYGWQDVDAIAGAEYTITRGNNVYASEDADANNNPGYSPDGGTSLKFDFTYNPAEASPINYKDFAITNLFVANNLLHDISHHYGFDEESGNFQTKNYNGLGIAGDAVNADAQDGSGTNNANFATPPDGSASRMQMYIWDGVGAKANLRVNNGTGLKFGVGITDGNWGTPLTANPVTGKLVLVKDNTTANTNKCCMNLSNGSEVSGNIAAIVRGGCTFVQKVYRAQSYGATAVVLLDTSAADAIITMATDNTSQASKVKIPVIFARLSDANKLRALLSDSNINITFYDSSAYAKKTDSDLDLGVMAHEYTHGISTRLTCGPSNSNGLSNAEQMGEGWSDFIGVAFTAKKGDVGSKVRGVGNWLVGQDQTGDGIRTYPYTTNMTLNPHTYGNLAKAASGIKTEVHYTGEIWCTMLWDMYWNFVDKYGFDEDLYNGKGGNNRAVQVVIDAMKLQPCGPGFVDGRDAILAADSIRYGGANKKLIWDAFARRGLGYSAAQGSANNCADGEEAFDLPPVPASGLDYLQPQWFKAHPNPASEIFVVEPMNVQKIDMLQIYDLKGQIQKVSTIEIDGGGLQVDVRSLSAGIYWVSVTGGGQSAVVKLIKP